MGHKAMVAYRTGADSVDLHFSPWGADKLRLIDRISQNNPYGEKTQNAEYISSADQESDTTTLKSSPTEPAAVNPHPKKRDIPIDAAATEFSYLFVEAFYVVDTDWTVRGFVTVPYQTEAGVLVECKPHEYGQIFEKTRTSPWKDITSKAEWTEQVTSTYGDRIPAFSPRI